MRKTTLFIGSASYIILGVPSLLFSGETGDFGLMLVTLMGCALVVSSVLSAVAFSVARDNQTGTRQPRSVFHLIELAVLGLPAFVAVALVTVVLLGMLVILLTRLVS